MKLNKNEKLLISEIKSFLEMDSELGLSIHDKEEFDSLERGYEYLHNQIDDMFHLKTAELDHCDGINASFSKVHQYKYIDDPKFKTAMQKEMVGQGIPADERAKSIEFIDKIIKQLKEEKKEWAEKDSGFNPNMSEIRKIAYPKKPKDFEIHDTPLNKSNLTKFEKGDASQGRTPSNDEHQSTIK